LTTHPI